MCVPDYHSKSESESDEKDVKTVPNKEKVCSLRTQIGEIHDFYVNRLLDSSTKQYKIVATHNRTDAKGLNNIEINYSISRFQREPQKYRNGCTVRVPEMFWLRNFDMALLNDAIVSKGIFKGKNALAKKQWGSHILLDNSANVKTLSCFLNEKFEYCAQKPSTVNCIYPVLRNFTQPSDTPEMVLGSRYSANIDKKGDRTFGKDEHSIDNAPGVWDITENFLDSTSLFNYMSEEFSAEKRRYALYVCEDTRLIVTDDRGSNKAKDNLTTSLYQQGSLVVFEVEPGTELMVGPQFWVRQLKREEDTGKIKEQLKPTLCRFTQLGKNGYLDKSWFHGVIPEEERDPIVEPSAQSKINVIDSNNGTGENDKSPDKLYKQRRFVIFLGATESQHNTVCWKLELSSDEPKCILRPPDGARIMDVLPWSKGFEQIVSRHRYQRLFEAVLYPEIWSKMGFSVPNDEKMLKRILGLCQDDSSLSPIIIFDTSKHFKKSRYPAYLKPEINEFQRMTFVEGVIERDDWKASNPYPVQPLHAPIAQLDSNEQSFLYLKYGTNPVQVNDSVYKINGKEYESFVKQIPEYSWKLLGRITDFKDKCLTKHSKQHRIGVDWMVYETQFEKIGSINSAIFYLNENHGKQQDDVIVPVKSNKV